MGCQYGSPSIPCSFFVENAYGNYNFSTRLCGALFKLFADAAS